MDSNGKKIAVIGMACRFPGANNIDQYWANLLEGKDTIKRFSDAELSPFEFRHDELITNPDFVRARGILDNVDRFDAHFFGMTPRESAFTDPQHRVWLETAWEALENAGLDPSNFQGAIGVFAGGCSNTYLLNNILRDSTRLEDYIRLRRSDSFQIFTGNDVSFIPTKTAYHFNLKGPAVNVQTTCSTSLVAISMACQSLYDLNSDVCLAGAICIMVPQETGYIFQAGAIHSPDGYVHPFDARARGTVFSNGVGIVVLKRLDDAIKDCDNIYAVVRGWAVNNDGNNKISYTAPSIDGQSEVVSMAHSFAGISPEDVDYIETHGTGTQLGDPIEISALKKAFSAKTNKKQFCGIGSVKSNIGHTDVAAGVASFIKACLISHNRKIPALINFSEPNPFIDFENSPFYVQRELREFTHDKPFIIGVSSFGIGGTNAHVIIEESPAVVPDPVVVKGTFNDSKWPYLLPLSAKSPSSLDSRKKNILDYFEKNPDLEPEDVAYTLQKGRQHMVYRTFKVVKNVIDLKVDSFADMYESSGQLSGIVFMFPGQGAQYTGMGKDLYYSNSNFRRTLDECFSIVISETGIDLKEILYGNPGSEDSERRLASTEITQPAIFIIEYALAKLYEGLGIKPKYLIGHSIGEYVAACISGVFDLNSALKIVIKRASLMSRMPSGRMMAVRGSFEKLVNLKSLEFEFAADNADNQCTISYKREDADAVISVLDTNEIKYIQLNSSHGFHSSAFDPILQEFANYIDNFVLKAPGIPLISCLTGDFITPGDAMSGNYWAKQLRNTVRFRQGISAIANREDVLFLEVGPETHLTGLARQNSDVGNKKAVVTSLGKNDGVNENDKIIGSIGAIWANGINTDFDLLHYGSNPRKIVLPSYPFLRERHWIDHVPGRVVAEVEKLPSEPVSVFKPETPQTIEMKIAAIWEELLGIKSIGVTDNFFFLGGHSLLALQIINRINEEFHSEITLEIFFKFPTIRELISNVTLTSEFKESVHVTSTADYSLPQPLSPAQERLWIINQIENNNPSYNISFSFLFEGTLDKKIFQESLEELFERHKILKSHIRTMNGSPYVVINPGFKIYISEMDFSEFSGIDQDNKVKDFIKNESRTKFYVEDSSLYRITLIDLGKEKILFHFTIHHLIFDGWSWGVFTKELKETYNSLLIGEKAKLEPLPIDYFEFARLAREEKKPKSLEEYWRNKLNGITGQLNFPLDFKRHEISTGEGGRVMLNIGKERTARLREYSKKENVTLYMLFLSVFGLLLSRYSGDKDICLGSPTANRPVSKLEKLIGLFINSIVLRLQIDEEISFSKFLNTVRNDTIEALSHQGLPFENLVDILQPPRILNMNPIFQVMIAWQNTPRPPLDLRGIKSSRVFQENGVSPLDITLYAWEEEDNIVGEIEFSTDILKRSTIEALRENFISLVDNIISNPEISLKNISILSDHEKERIARFNKTDVNVPELPLQALFEASVKKFAGKTAIEVISGGNRISYSNLEKLSNQLAHYLRKNGFRQGSIAGISMDRSESMVVAVLGVLKSGGTYLPLDPSFPDDRLFYMLEDSGATALITEENYRNRYKNSNTLNIVYDTELSDISIESSDDPKNNVDLNTIAYIIYTSGSTGRPKGVKVHHKAVVNLINSMSKEPGLSPEDRLLAVTTLSFDISVLELFLPLSSGATVLIANNDHARNGEALARIIEEFNISFLQATPATWTILLASGWKGKRDLKALSGGEALQPGLARDLIGKVNSLWNLYGPTETTIYSSCELITDYDRILIGRPIDNTQFHILYNNQEQPVGAIGELCIGGMGVSKGYHNREDLNTEKFFKWDDQIMYRTGDLARFLDNGKIELFGRTDNQIKLHGFRIEPGEIEFQLSQIDGVKEAVVKLEMNGEKDFWLIGYLNVTDSFKLNREQIVKSIENHLPGYMVPSSFMIMKEFPRTLNGKIDRKALTFNINNIPEEEKEDITELSDFENSLVKIWQEVLKIKNLKRNQSFFDIGGNSLLSIQILTRIKEELNLNISFKTFLQNPTIDKLSSQLKKTGQVADKTIELIHLTEKTNLPLTLNQKRLWLISKLQPDIPSYIIQYTWYMEGSLDREIFQKSLEILFQRHQIVFSVIQEVNGEPFCDIVPREVNISFIDFSGLPENEKKIKVNDIINADSGKVFDLKNGPLYRLYLIMTNANEYYFNISIHHIIFDGWSWTVLVNDLNEIYNSLLNEKEINLERIEFQQYDYAYWENNFANFNKRNDLIEFWKNNLNGASSILNFPYDFQREEQPSGKGGYEPIHISKELSEKLRRISKKEDSSLFTTMFSVFGIQMHKYSGQYDINIGLPVAYRPLSKLENIFGMFVNTVVVRLRLEKNLTFRDIIHLTNETTLNAIAHQELPFESIVDLVNPERVSNVNPLFQVGFVWENNLNIPLKLNGIRSKRISGTERTTPFDIVMYLWEDGATIQGEIEYSTDLLKHETILRLKNNFLTLIDILLENSDTVLSSLSIINEDDKKLIEEINNTITPYPKNKTIAQLFEDQITLYPDKIAVAINKDFLTYKQLNEKANQLARTLRKSGVGPDIPVGILTDKTLDWIVGVLGILKAGGGYVPIESEYPVQRIDYILKDSGCKVLLTQNKYINIPVEGVRKLNLNSKDSYHSDKSDVERINDSSSLAYIMYTSGTTGKPKGSMIQQYSVVRLVRNTNYIELTSDDRILLTGAIGFDATTFEIWGALLNGGTLFLAEKETIINPRTLGEALRKNDITILWLTSPLFTMIAESQTDIFSKLKYLLSGGDVLSTSHINKVRKDNPHLKIINGYGPTENTTFSTTYLIEKDFDRNIPIGKPISNSTAYIFDSYMNYQPVGVIGELYVGGDGLSKGYLNHEDLNSKSFIDHPYLQGEKIYKTGDFARLLMDGNIEFHGRIDNQLKIRGFRVELGEIESVISEMEGIIDVVIKPIKIKEGDTRLAAFLNVSDAFSMDSKELKKRIKEKLPPQMIPSMFKLMHGFPKTINGKIDKDALRVDITVTGIEEPEENGQLTPTEKKIYDIWCKALLTQDILKTDNFFDVGGSSLLAASVLSKLESQFKINLRLKTIFDNPRLKDLADFIDGSLPVLSKK